MIKLVTRLIALKQKYERIKKLYTIGAKSDQELEDAELDYNTAVSSYEGVMSNVEDTIIISARRVSLESLLLQEL